MTYEVINPRTGYSFGIYRARTADEAVEACCRDAGYKSKADAAAQTGREIELVAFDAAKHERSLDDDA